MRTYLTGALVLLPLLATSSFGKESPVPQDVRVLLGRLEVQEKSKLGPAYQALNKLRKRAQPAIPALIHSFDHGSVEMRWSAMQMLIKMGPVVVPPLSNSLKAKDPMLRQDAAYALGLMKGRAKQAVPDLLEGLRDPVPQVRWQCANALGNIGPAAKNAVPTLLSLGTDANSAVRRVAAESLAKIKPAAMMPPPWLAKALVSRDLATRRDAIYMLRRVGRSFTGALNYLAQALKDIDPLVRKEAVISLRNFGEEAKASISVLLKCMSDVDAGVRVETILTLGALKPTNYSEVTSQLIKALKDAHPGVRQEAAALIGRLGENAKSALPALVAAMKGKDVRLADAASDAMTGLGAVSIPEFIKALRDANEGVRIRAARGLGGVAQHSPQAIAALQAALKDKSVAVAQEAVKALGMAGGNNPAAILALQEALHHKNADVTRQAAEALGRIGPDAIPGLVSLLEAKANAIRTAPPLVGSVQPTLAEVVERLTKGLKHESEFMRWHKAQQLGVLGAHAKKAVPALIQTLADGSPQVRSASAEALSKMGSIALPPLTQALKSKNAGIRIGVAHALGQMGSEAKGALDALETALNDENGEVRAAIGDALKKIARR